jgi:hypothetical protein
MTVRKVMQQLNELKNNYAVLVESFKKIEAQGEGNLTIKNGDMTAVQPALLQCA